MPQRVTPPTSRGLRGTAAAVSASLLAGLLPPLPATAQNAPAPKASSARGHSPALKSEAPVTVNFVNAEIEAVTRAMAAMIERQIMVDPRVKGTITVYSEQPVSVREAYLNYLAALRGLGFAMVDVAGLLKVVPEADAKLQAGTVAVGATATRGDQVITQIFKLNHENPNNLVAVLRPLISPNNTINANPGNNSLVITDYADNLARIGKIIAALDQPSATDVEIVPLQHAVASDIAALVQRLGDGGAAAGATAGATAAGGSATVLADPRSNALIIRGANPAKLAQMRALVEKLDRPMGSGPAGMINVVYLKHADAAKLATVLRAAFGAGAGSGTGGLSGGTGASASPAVTPATLPAMAGTNATGANSTAATTPVSQSAQPSTGGFIQADPATNSLVITAPPPLYRQIRAVIDQLDARRNQVFIESMIVEMDAQKAAQFGFQWQGLLGKSGDSTGLVAGTNFGSGNGNIVTLSAAAATGTLSGSVTQGLNVGVVRAFNGVYTLASLANFLNSVDGSNILSTPNLIALDNEEAKIVVGQNVPFVTGSYTNATTTASATVNPFQTIERKDVGLTLRVKPQIGEGGVVRMTVYQENSSVVAATATSTTGPTTNKSSIETNVVVDDGQIIVLGGQLKDQYSDNTNGVPGLDSIPLFGNLFKNESRNRRKSVLLVFLRPVVLRDAASASQVTLDRYEAIRAEQKDAQPRNSTLLPINESPVLPPMRAPQGATPAPVPAAPAAPASQPTN